MAIALLKIKIMPELNSDLDKIKEKIEENINKEGGKLNKIEKEEIAFGLKALILTITWPEEKETERAEKACRVKGVSSLDIIDYRRAFG